MSTSSPISPDLVDLALSRLDNQSDHRDVIQRWLTGCVRHTPDDGPLHEARRRRVAEVLAAAVTDARDETQAELTKALYAVQDVYHRLDDGQPSSVEAQAYLDACRRVESLERTLGLRG